MNTPLPELQPLPDAERRHVAVVGAGLVGLCTALWLQRMGHRVTIIDPAPPLGDASYRQACSYGNACTFAPHGVVPVATSGVIWRVPRMLLNPLGPLAIVWRYLPQLVPWLRAFLASSTKAEVERIAGTLAVLLSHADAAWQPLVIQAGAERLKRHDGCLYLYKTEAQFRAADAENALRERHGVAMDRLDRADVRNMEPNLAPLYHKGVLFRDAYVFSSPRQLAFALAQAVIRGGGEIVRGEVSVIEPRGNGICLRIADKQILTDHAVVAAGAHSQAYGIDRRSRPARHRARLSRLVPASGPSAVAPGLLSRTRLLHGADGRWIARGWNRRTWRACCSLEPQADRDDP